MATTVEPEAGETAGEATVSMMAHLVARRRARGPSSFGTPRRRRCPSKKRKPVSSSGGETVREAVLYHAVGLLRRAVRTCGAELAVVTLRSAGWASDHLQAACARGRGKRVGSASLGFEPEWHTVIPAARHERCPSCGIRVECRVRRGARMPREHVHHEDRRTSRRSATRTQTSGCCSRCR